MNIVKRAYRSSLILCSITAVALSFSSAVFSNGWEPKKGRSACRDLPAHGALTHALKSTINPTAGVENGGLELHMWATLVARDGTVCAVTRSGDHPGDQWPGSRVISAQKANTANAFSLPGLALSTANLYAAVQPGGSLYGLQHSNPVNANIAYSGNFSRFGTRHDPLVGKRIGGVNVFGGGLALYSEDGRLLGALGVSGDTSCADHNIAWRVREFLGLNTVPGGVQPMNGDDGIIYDQNNGFSHPDCGNMESVIAVAIKAGN